MNSTVINMDYLVTLLSEHGVIVSEIDEKIISIEAKDKTSDLSYSISNGALVKIHFKVEDFEILYEASSDSTFLKLMHHSNLHTAVVEN